MPGVNRTKSAELGAPNRFGQQFLLADQSHVLPLQELQLLQRPRDHRVPSSATGRQHGEEVNLQALNLYRVHCSRESIQLSASLLRASHELDRPQVAAGRRCCGA
jgi:hypothetical protein